MSSLRVHVCPCDQPAFGCLALLGMAIDVVGGALVLMVKFPVLGFLGLGALALALCGGN